jgi:hypothetical protein
MVFNLIDKINYNILICQIFVSDRQSISSSNQTCDSIYNNSSRPKFYINNNHFYLIAKETNQRNRPDLPYK